MNARYLLIPLLLLWACQPQAQQVETIEGFPLSEDSYKQELLEQLRDSVDAQVYKRLNSIVAIKGGKLLFEEYYNGTKRRQVHDVRSVGKTFASATLGIAIEEGHIKSVDQPLSDFYDLKQYAHYNEAKANVKLKDLLTMSSSFLGDDNSYESPGNEGNMYPQENWVEWALNLPMDSSRVSGESWAYFTAGVVILGDILEQNVPNGLEEYADEKLFGPLGINRYFWEYTPQRVANTAGGIRLTPLGFAKFGQLYLQDGKWGDQQILPAQWVKDSHTAYLTAYGPNEYGYLWWIKSYEVGDKSYKTHYCSGNGGNKIFVFKELDMVIVVTASAYGQRYGHRQIDDIMQRYILPAVISP